MITYRNYESWLSRWAYLPDNILGLGNPNKVPVWSFWMRAAVVTPAIVTVGGATLYTVAEASWRYPKGLAMVLFILWITAAVVGGLLKIVDKKLQNEGEDDARDFIHFE